MKRALIFAALLAFAAPASATLQLSANVNGAIFNCVDQAACDSNPVVGQLSIASLLLNGVEIIGSSQFQTIGTTNFLNTSSFQIINHNLAVALIQLAISGIDFLGPVSTYDASGSGTWQNAGGSTINLSFYGDASNTQGANFPTDLPGTLLASFADVAAGPADAFSFSNTGAFLAAGLHGLSLGTSGTLAAWNGLAGQEATLVGRSQTIITQPQAVPEPQTVALLGLGLIALGWTQRHRLRS